MLTATLPPCKKRKFFEEIKLTKKIVTIFRKATTRKNISYSTVRIKKKADESVIKLIKRKLEQYKENKMMVYGNNIKRMKKITSKLEYKAYYREIKNKKKMFKRIRKRKYRLIIIINALKLEIDITDIRIMIYMDIPRRLRDFEQKSGRTNRNKRINESIVIVRKDKKNRNDRIVKLYKKKRYFREILNKYLDGRINRKKCKKKKEIYKIC